jgi:hypothetical protein
MTERCWDELYRAGQELAQGGSTYKIVYDAATDFDLPSSPEAEAARVFLSALCGALADEELLEAEAALGEAAE